MNGDQVTFDKHGSVCDGIVNDRCWCEAGPPVFSVNGNGFPSVRKVAISVATWEPDFNQCYGDERDLNSTGGDVCPHDPGGSGPFRPQPGDVFLNLRTTDCPFEDKAFRVDASELRRGAVSPYPSTT
jgi:hypothetical protein